MGKFFRLFISLILLLASHDFIFSSDKLIDNFFIYNTVPDKNNFVVVDKFQNKLFVYEVKDSNNLKLIKDFKILVGENKGDKERKGDKKTPEGIYFVQNFISSKKLSPKYGPGAFTLDYPNPFDKIFDKTGGGIWIHGFDENENKNSTEGCVVLNNKDFLELSKYIKSGTPVIITNKLSYLNTTQYSKNKKDHLNTFNLFLKNWIDGDFEKFKLSVDEKYNNDGINYKSFLASKKALFNKINYRKIVTSDLIVYKENSKLLFDFNQFYCASNLSVYGRKKMYFFKEKLITEDFKDYDKREFVKKEVVEFINKWISSWEAKNIGRYKAAYSDKFPHLKDWIKDKQDKFTKYKTINVEYKNLSIKEETPIRYSVSFLQTFKTNNYQDIGLKRITLEGCPGDFKIASETWEKSK